MLTTRGLTWNDHFLSGCPLYRSYLFHVEHDFVTSTEIALRGSRRRFTWNAPLPESAGQTIRDSSGQYYEAGEKRLGPAVDTRST